MCKETLLYSVVLKNSVEIDFRLRKLMIYASFYKIHELNITFCSMYTVQVGSWSGHHPTLWRVTDTYFYSASLRTGQTHGFQNLTYSSGKTPDPFQKRRLSPLPEPCLDKFCFSSHFTACWVCLSSVSLGHCAWKAHSIPKFLHSLFCLLNHGHLADGQNP